MIHVEYVEYVDHVASRFCSHCSADDAAMGAKLRAHRTSRVIGVLIFDSECKPLHAKRMRGEASALNRQDPQIIKHKSKRQPCRNCASSVLELLSVRETSEPRTRWGALG